ncbi:MAG TPA: BamA/TamA family outer membrane protein [Gemmatimonadales bacterium]|nr:BamA/TamA family outer membrane protein [Gemmatimonadales bacterium]
MNLGLALFAALQIAPSPASRNDTVVVQAGPQHGGGSLRRLLFGEGWRQLWTTPFSVPVADLDSLRGGLTAFEKGGSSQTQVLRFSTRDGRIYSFRSIDKDPAQAFHGLMRLPINQWMANEQISAMMPIGALAAGQLERAAGIIPTERWLAVLPDDPRLGKWRDEFKGMLGIFERRFTREEASLPEVPSALELSSTDSLLPKLRRSSADRVDQPAYLTMRLLDLLIGDWDRHAAQWVWLRFDRGGVHWWTGVPRDRDWAFSRFDHLVWRAARFFYPIWTEFSPRYGRLKGLTLTAEVADRLLLTGLDRDAWSQVAMELRARLNDSVIAQAVAALPPEFPAPVLEELANGLRNRRDSLPQIAAKFYRDLAQVVVVHGTDEPEVAEVTRNEDGSVLVQLFDTARATLFQRRFVPAETAELRLDLWGGADTVRVHGNPNGIPLRVITLNGPDVVVDSTGGGTVRVYDDSGSAQVLGSAAHITHSFAPPPPPNKWGMRRDWGHRLSVAPWFAVRPQLGINLGGGPVFFRYGFRKSPYQSRTAVRLATTTKAGELNADFNSDFRFERPQHRISIRAELLNADVIRYYGVGNERARSTTGGFNNVVQRRYDLEPMAQIGIGGSAHLRLGAVLRWSETEADRPTLLTLEQPYGAGSFTEAGVVAGIGYDSRDQESAPTRGVSVELTGRLFPSMLDVASAFGSVGAVGTTYLTAANLPASPTLALRAGARRVFGTYPFFEAVSIGGRYSLRGLTSRRFAGDAAVYGNLELRFNFKRFGLGNWGILGLTDFGRVYLAGETSTRWHTAVGGGLWTAISRHQRVLSATLAGTRGEPVRFYVNSGFQF